MTLTDELKRMRDELNSSWPDTGIHQLFHSYATRLQDALELAIEQRDDFVMDTVFYPGGTRKEAAQVRKEQNEQILAALNGQGGCLNLKKESE